MKSGVPDPDSQPDSSINLINGRFLARQAVALFIPKPIPATNLKFNACRNPLDTMVCVSEAETCR